jgi:hypothetical protein
MRYNEIRTVMIRHEDGDVVEGEYPSPTQAKQAANAWNKKYGTKPTDNGGAYVKEKN